MVLPCKELVPETVAPLAAIAIPINLLANDPVVVHAVPPHEGALPPIKFPVIVKLEPVLEIFIAVYVTPAVCTLLLV